MNRALGTLLIGVGMGAVLSRIGFSSWDEVHRMFTFADLRMFLAFACAVALLFVAVRWTQRSLNVSFAPRPIHRGTILGGVMFGLGWALSGACPAIVFVQLGEGQLAALYTLAGILVGNYAYALLRERYLRWDMGSYLDD